MQLLIESKKQRQSQGSDEKNTVDTKTINKVKK